MSATPTCLSCGGATETGFVVDMGHYDARRQEEWWEGRPQRAFWSGIKKPERTHKIASWRCTRCGFLMDFAVSNEG